VNNAADEQVGVGIIGCGNVFDWYARGLARFERLRVIRCADIEVARAEDRAKHHGIPHAGTVEDLLADPAVDIVVNTTPPNAHSQVTQAALRAGKHVYSEKPLSLTLEDADETLACALANDRVLGVATDTFLGSANQTARAILDSGHIGTPIAASVFLTHARVEKWHPNPGFLFTRGGGALLDRGPYYVANLVNCLGPVREVFGMTTISQSQREVTAPARLVDTVKVDVSTHAAAVMRCASGAIVTVMMSLDVWDANLPHIEIYGTLGTLSLPNPCAFDGEVRVKLHDDADWRVVPPVIPPTAGPSLAEQFLRGHGVADLEDALRGAPHRTNATLGRHVLEVLNAVELASSRHALVELETSCERPEPVYEDAEQVLRLEGIAE
jgi:predicted dehydrogenase